MNEQKDHRGSWRHSLALGALGVVYGDIGTSPIYTMNVICSRESGIPVMYTNLLGVLSLIFWSLLLVVSLKYMYFVLKAQHQGDGGVIALATLLRRPDQEGTSRLLLLGIIACALLLSDGMLTPAISVLSAVQGLELVSTRLNPYVPALTLFILILLFAIQRRGTAAIGAWFGPVMLLWFLLLGLTGLLQIPQAPAVLQAVNPWFAFHFIETGGWAAFLILGSVFLVVTGSEALYADLGHFGLAPIRRTWLALAWPALVLNYFGQGALLLSHSAHPGNTFFALFPSPLLLPAIALATIATVIASQAVITGAYSLTRPLAELDYFPPWHTRHTSTHQSGRIYIAATNWLLMCGTLLLVVLFRSADGLASAYGVAIGGVSLITSLLYLVYYRQRLRHGRLRTTALGILLLGVDGAFLLALLAKLLSGALVVLLISALLLTVMLIWHWGRERVREEEHSQSLPIVEFLHSEPASSAERIPGTAVFLTRNPARIPPSLRQNFRHNRVLHRESYLLYIEVRKTPRFRLEEKFSIEKLGSGFFAVTYCVGYMETPRFEHVSALLEQSGYPIAGDNLSVFTSHTGFAYGDAGTLALLRARLYALMARNSPAFAMQLDIPQQALIEIGVQHQL